MSARRQKRKQSGGLNATVAAPRKSAVPKPRPPMSRRRKWLFRLAAMILAPLLFFSVLEAGLRLGGYGYPTTFFVGPDAAGVYTSNLQFGWRFFPRPIARTPVPCVLSAKPAGSDPHLRSRWFGGAGRSRAVVQVGPDSRSLAARSLPGREFQGGQCGDDGDQFARGAGDRPRLRRPSAGPLRRLYGKQRGGWALRPGHRLPAMVAEPQVHSGQRVAEVDAHRAVAGRRDRVAPSSQGRRHGVAGLGDVHGQSVSADDPRLPAVYDNSGRTWSISAASPAAPGREWSFRPWP